METPETPLDPPLIMIAELPIVPFQVGQYIFMYKPSAKSGPAYKLQDANMGHTVS